MSIEHSMKLNYSTSNLFVTLSSRSYSNLKGLLKRPRASDQSGLNRSDISWLAHEGLFMIQAWSCY